MYQIAQLQEKHNWIKQSIFWELPYSKNHLVYCYLDMMHVEKNVFDNFMHIVINSDRIKDNEKTRMDLEEYCRCLKLNLQPLRDDHQSKPKASYTLTSVQRQDVSIWVQELKMTDNYALNLGRCVNVAQGKFISMKSHN